MLHKYVDFLLYIPYNINRTFVKKKCKMNNEKKIGQIVRQLRGSRSLREFAELCDISHTALDAIECGINKRSKKPTQAKTVTLQRIADAAGVPLSYITGDRSGPIKIPVLGYVAAGIPIEAIEDVLDYEEISPDMLKDGSEFFALKLKGSSMEPRMSDGDVVIVRIQSTLDSGEIGIVCVNGDHATCKKVMKQSGGIVLQPLNPAYEPVFYSNEQIEDIPITILGRVVELRAKF